MAMVVKVRFRRASKLYDFDANGLEVSAGSYIVTETIRGMEIGECMGDLREVGDDQMIAPLKPILRIATEEDLNLQRENEEREKQALLTAEQKVQDLKLDMKLVDVEFAFDRSKITFYFTADGRVDFRILVKSLASVFKTRIELRQIGVRDEAKMLGGLGPCGRPICCRQFLADFQPVSIKMAKEQNLSLNPTKISGICDRLMCCLKYEQEHYENTRKKMPKIGRELMTPDGIGVITAINVLSETVTVRLPVGDSFENRVY
ncbi:MAG: stage 0 sporulation family protein, partial [Clostridia bacterium]|nr:stage 0 sporulation family protein [Clostridia bacterium]